MDLIQSLNQEQLSSLAVPCSPQFPISDSNLHFEFSDLFGEPNEAKNVQDLNLEFSSNELLDSCEDLDLELNEFNWFDQNINPKLFQDTLQDSVEDNDFITEILSSDNPDHVSQITQQSNPKFDLDFIASLDAISTSSNHNITSISQCSSPQIMDVDRNFSTENISCPSSPEQLVPSPGGKFFVTPESPLNIKVECVVDLTDDSTIIVDDIPFSLEVHNETVTLLEDLGSACTIDKQVFGSPKKSDKKNVKDINAINKPQFKSKKINRQVRCLDSSERKQRKKGQNKTAATRYRQKKRVELDILQNEKQVLVQANDDLHSKIDKISSEILYLKSLLREAYTAKGLFKRS